MTHRNATLGLALSLFLMGTAYAQTTTASLFGVARDKSGAVVPQAKVTAQNAGTGLSRETQTDETGAYLITNLPVGQYSLTFEKQGFRAFHQDGIVLRVDDHARVDAALEVGQITENVTVTAEATGVDTRSASIGEVVDHTRIEELPLNGRNAMSLSRIVPGVAKDTAPTALSQARQGPSISTGGGRDTENEVRFDGAPNASPLQNTLFNLPSPDALQEFKVETSNFTAEYGRFGGGLFLAATRSGTNQVHGTLWEYLRNADLNARNFFSTTKPDLKQNQFGFTAGGPVIRNKTFIFGSYQGTRIRQSLLMASAVPPTAAERQGDFSNSAIKPIDPLTGAPFPGSQIPSTQFDSVAVKVMNQYVPSATTPDGRIVQLVSEPTTGDQYLWRLDHSFSSKNTASLRYFRDVTQLQFPTGNIPNYVTAQQQLANSNWSLQDTNIFGPTLLNEFRISVERYNSPTSTLQRTQLSDFGAIYPGVNIPQMPNINTTGYFSLGSNDQFRDSGNYYRTGDTLRWFRGRHSVSVGGEFSRNEYFGRGNSANQGTFTFDGSITKNAFADYLIGRPSQLAQSSPYDRLLKGWDWYAFVQDDMRLTSRLTLSAGLRYQWFNPYKVLYDRVTTFQAGVQSVVVPNAPLGLLFPGDPGVTDRLFSPDKRNFAPRLGLAWDPLGNGRLGIRAGYGLFFEDQRTDPWIYPAVNQPFVIQKTVFDPYSFTDPYRGQQDPFPYIYTAQTARFSLPMGLTTVSAPVVKLPYVHHLSFSVEKSLPANTVLKVGYSGKLAHNLLRMNELNPAVYIPGQSTIANTDQRRIILPGIYSNVRQISGSSDSAYHALEVSVNKRLSRGFTIMGAYTFSKFLDYYSATNLGQFPQDPLQYACRPGAVG